MMEKKYLPVLAFALIIGAATVLAGCAESIAYNDSYTITHTDAEFPLHVTSNDYMVGDRALVSLYGGQPACGHVRGTPTYSGSPATVRSNPPFIFSRSSGVAAGAYRFQYMLSVSTYDYPIVGGSYENSTATVTLILTETYPSPDGSPECASPYQAFINSASYSGGVVTVQWQVPEGVQYADSYEIAIYNGEPNSGHEFLTNQNLRNPRNHSPQTSNLRPSARPTLFWVVLITKLNYREVFRDTLRGVQGEPPGFILVDDHVRLIKGSVERATVDVLANDTDLRPNAGTARGPWVRLAGASLSIVSDGGLPASINGGQQVEVDATSAETGQYTVAIETTVAGYDPQTQYLYVDVSNPQQVPPTANDDTFTGVAGETTLLPVLDNDTAYQGGALTIAGFTQPGGDATVSQAGSALQINGPPGNYDFTYTAQDEFGNTATANVHVTLIKRAPIPQRSRD